VQRVPAKDVITEESSDEASYRNRSSHCSRRVMRKESQQPQPFVPRMSLYRLVLLRDSLQCRNACRKPAGGLEKILFPPFDADNPRLPFLGNNVHNIKVRAPTVEDPLAEGAWAAIRPRKW